MAEAGGESQGPELSVTNMPRIAKMGGLRPLRRLLQIRFIS
jgi:hypothetical protein